MLCAITKRSESSQNFTIKFLTTLRVNREAIKVFLEFLEPFSSEKGSKPPEALKRSDKNAIASAKGGMGGKQEFSPHVFGGSTPTKTRD